MKWNVTTSLLFVSIMGWSVGVVPAVIDGTIAINRVMHNTLWVPGHFHIYLLFGVVAMLFGFMYFLGMSTGAADSALDRAAVWMYVVGRLAFAISFLAAGAVSVPRRWAVHDAPWMTYDRIGVLFALVVVARRGRLRHGVPPSSAGDRCVDTAWMRTAIASLAICVAGGALLWRGTDGFRALTSEAARRRAIAASPRAVPVVELEDQDGRPFTLAALSRSAGRRRLHLHRMRVRLSTPERRLSATRSCEQAVAVRRRRRDGFSS